jgi:hypothetical protein
LFDRIIIKASGNAISKAVILVEEIKNRYSYLHQQNTFTINDFVDVYEPIYFGLETVQVERYKTTFECILSKEAIDEDHPGYQPPGLSENPKNKLIPITKPPHLMPKGGRPSY